MSLWPISIEYQIELGQENRLMIESRGLRLVSIVVFCCMVEHLAADDLSTVERIFAVGSSQHFYRHHTECSRGTLLQWDDAAPLAGGPNLKEPLVTDRPDFTEASSTVGLGVTQLEFGYTYTYDNNAGASTRSQSFGEPLLRHGIVDDWLELRVALFPVEQQTTVVGATDSTSGTEDLYVGFKIGLTPQQGILPEMALIPQMNLPTGSSAFTSDLIEPGLNWIYGWEINDFISTAGSTQGNRRADATTGQDYLEMAQSWTFAYSCTEELGAYTEWFALIPNNADTDQTQHYFNGGFTYLISSDVQFDIRAGVGLNDAADDYFLGTGLSIRMR